LKETAKIFVAGHKGLVGSALVRRLKADGYRNFILKTRDELDLRNQSAVENFFRETKPEYVFLSAAKVGGIYVNSKYPADFIYDNLMIETNVIHNAYKYEVTKLLFLGSSCIYPKLARQPIDEEQLLTGPLEPTNEAYAIAKIAGIKMCEAYSKQFHIDFISAMPVNLYGPFDNFDLEGSHVIPALLRKFHDAKIKNLNEVEVWGSGTPRREFMFVDDLADACLFLMNNYNGSKPVNVGTGSDLTISELAECIKKITGFSGNIRWDRTMPDGTPAKLLDVSKINRFGWKSQISLEDGLKMTYEWFLKNSQHNF
jgi:GDP-L-fucose synthase